MPTVRNSAPSGAPFNNHLASPCPPDTKGLASAELPDGMALLAKELAQHSGELRGAGVSCISATQGWLEGVAKMATAEVPDVRVLREASAALHADQAALDGLCEKLRGESKALSAEPRKSGNWRDISRAMAELSIDADRRRMMTDLSCRITALEQVKFAISRAAGCIDARLASSNAAQASAPDMKILCEHPIDPAVREKIMAEIDNIERTHNVHVLFACESGSRAWGFASPDSDYDVRFIYAHEPEWYFRVDPQRDVIELPISAELDISGWELRKALGLLRKSNPTLFDWMDSPVVYKRDETFIKRLRTLSAAHFYPTSGRYHYLSMAKRNHREYLQGETVSYKKYLYVLRPLLAVKWIDAGKGVPPMRFADLVAGTVDDPATITDLNALLAVKTQSREQAFGPRRATLDAFIDAALADAEVCPAYKKPQGDPSSLDRLLFETVIPRGQI
ncbi:MAG: hypothetical protein RIR70_1315 [Pseudomonadota bacterium]|jgi:predicted nucleotidyltransferase